MNWLDMVILVVLVLLTFGGLKQGIIKAVLSLAGLVLGITLASRLYPTIAPKLTFISQPSLANIAAFVIILVAILIVASVLGFILTKVASAILLGWLNRLGGAVFGFFMGAVITSAALALWLKWLGPSNVISESAFAAVLVDKLPFALSLLPAEFDSIREFFR